MSSTKCQNFTIPRRLGEFDGTILRLRLFGLKTVEVISERDRTYPDFAKVMSLLKSFDRAEISEVGKDLYAVCG